MLSSLHSKALVHIEHALGTQSLVLLALVAAVLPGARPSAPCVRFGACAGWHRRAKRSSPSIFPFADTTFIDKSSILSLTRCHIH